MTPLFASRLSDSDLAFTQVVFHVPLAYAEVIQVMNHAFSSSGSLRCGVALGLSCFPSVSLSCRCGNFTDTGAG
ncbi:hypothetical protein [Pantoea sp. GD03673]|uniref:hypothetical protein n=1 Tax=Pantoea sp. GD03673 TaxID=2975364 RepID=UPI0024479A3B|nr:hypothetical protein [Pantoea sp. GD03673]MDH2068201.1 hypothetical protein [Pantoea sp. GD03673]